MGPGGDEGGVLAHLWPRVPAQTETLFPQPEMDCEVMGEGEESKKAFIFSYSSLGVGVEWGGRENKKQHLEKAQEILHPSPGFSASFWETLAEGMG